MSPARHALRAFPRRDGCAAAGGCRAGWSGRDGGDCRRIAADDAWLGPRWLVLSETYEWNRTARRIVHRPGEKKETRQFPVDTFAGRPDMLIEGLPMSDHANPPDDVLARAT